MAVVYAIQNGNWTDGTTWDTGNVPTADDVVYANGYTVTVSTDIIADTISTEMCPLTNIGGGKFTHSTSVNSVISANIIGGNSTCIESTGGGGKYITVNGDVKGSNSNACGISGTNTQGVIVNGNVYSYAFSRVGNYYYCYINGNVYSIDAPISHVLTNHTDEYYVNGTFHLGVKPNDLLTCSYKLVIEGKLKIYNNYNINVSGNVSHNITGIIDISNNTSDDFFIGTFSFGNNTKIIVRETSAVPQSVVLKGYEYGDKVGTLEVVPPTVTIVEEATVIESANVIEGDITSVNMTEEQLRRISNCATVSTVQKCFQDFKKINK